MDIATLGMRVDSSRLRNANRDLDAFQRNAAETGRAGQAMGAAIAKGLALVTAAISSVNIVNTLSQFDTAMSEVQAVSGATAAQMAAMRDMAKEMGASTRFSATDAANALAQLTSSGYSAEQSMAALDGTLSLAASGGIALGEAADIASDVLQQFGLSVEDTNRVVDVMAKQAATSSTTVAMTAAAMRNTGVTARALGLDVETTSAAIAALAESGIKGAMGGTALNAVLARLTDPTTEAAKSLDRFGLSVEDMDITSRGLIPVLEDLEAANIDLATANQLVGLEHGKALLSLLNNVEMIGEFTEANRDAAGSAKTMAEIMSDNLGGSLAGFRSAVEGLILAVGDAGLTDAIRAAVDAATWLVRTLSGLDNLDQIAMGVGILAGAISLAVAPMVTLAAAAATAALYIGANWGDLRNRFPGIVGAIEGAVETARGVFGGFMEAMRGLAPVAEHGVAAVKAAFAGDWTTAFTEAQAAGDAFVEWWNGLSIADSPAVAAITEYLSAFYASVSESFAPALENLRDAWAEVGPIVDNIAAAFDAIVKAVSGGETDWASVIGQIGGALGALAGLGLEAAAAAIKGIAGALQDITGAIAAAMKGDWQGVTRELDDFIGRFSTLGADLAAAVLDAPDVIVKLGADLVAALKDAAAAALAAALDIGNQIVAGIRQGIAEKLQGLKDYVSGLGASLAQSVRDILQIRSPSRVFATIGDQTMQGMALGISRTTPEVLATVDGMAASATETARDGFADMGQTVADAFGGLLTGAFDNFNDFLDSIGDAFLGAIRRMIATAAANPINLAMGVSGGGGGLLGGGQGGGGLLGNILGGSGGGIGGILGAFGKGIGNSIGSLFSGGFGSMFTSIGAQVGTAAATGTLTSIAGAAGSILGPIGLGLGIVSLFRTTKEIVANGIAISVRDDMATLMSYEKSKRTNRLGWSSGFSRKATTMDDEIQDFVAQRISATMDGLHRLGLGGSLSGFAFSARTEIKTGETAEGETEEVVRAALNAAIRFASGDAVSAFVRKGEDASDAVARLVTHLDAANGAMDALGHGLFEVGLRGADMASDLVSMFGDVQSFASATETYFRIFHTEEERRQTLLRQTAEIVSALGVAMPATRSEYRALVESFDLTSASGREMYATMISLAESFDAVLPRISTVSAALDGLITGTSSIVGAMIGEATNMASLARQAAAGWVRAASTLRDFLREMVNASSSSLSLAARNSASQSDFDDLVSRARAGDVDAARLVTGAARDLLDVSRMTVGSAVDYRIREAQIAARINELAGRADLEGAKLSLQETLYREQIDILNKLSAYLTTEGVTQEGIDAFVKQLGGVQQAIEDVEMLNVEFLRKRLDVAVEILADAKVPDYLRDLIENAKAGISGVISFSINDTSLTPAQRLLAMSAASQHLRTLEMVATVDPTVARLALATGSDLLRTVRAVAAPGITPDVRNLALATSSELLRTINVVLKSGADLDAMRLALATASTLSLAIDTAVTGDLTGDMRKLILDGVGTFSAGIEAALTPGTPIKLRNMILHSLANASLVLWPSLVAHTPESVRKLLVNSATSVARSVVLSALYPGTMPEAERALLMQSSSVAERIIRAAGDLGALSADDLIALRGADVTMRRVIDGSVDLTKVDAAGRHLLAAITGATAGHITLAGGVSVDIGSSVTDAVSQMGDAAERFSSGIGSLLGALRDIFDTLAREERIAALQRVAGGMIDLGNGRLIADGAQIQKAAIALGLDPKLPTAVLAQQIASYTGSDAIDTIHAAVPDVRQIMLGLVGTPGLRVDPDGYFAVRPDVGKHPLYANNAQLHWETWGRAEMLRNPNWFSLRMFDWTSIADKIPKFERGGLHLGGLRIVGERGPELEATGAARYYSASQTRSMIRGGDADMRDLVEEMRALRDEQRQIGLAVEGHTRKLRKLAEKDDVIGQPPERTVA